MLFVFNDTATTEIYTLSLHDALPISRLGLGVAVVTATVQRLTGTGRLVAGEFRPGGTGHEWCDAEVLRSVRRRSLAKLRQEVEPDRKSTRLNSSHANISYAVFCLKKKKKIKSVQIFCYYVFFFNDTATTEIYTLSLHDALPISSSPPPSSA